MKPTRIISRIISEEEMVIINARRLILYEACNAIAVMETPSIVALGSQDYYNGFQLGLLTAIACIAKIEP